MKPRIHGVITRSRWGDRSWSVTVRAYGGRLYTSASDLPTRQGARAVLRMMRAAMEHEVEAIEGLRAD